MLGLGVPEVVLIVLLVLLFFGGKRIPEIARGVGTGIRNFKRSVDKPEELEGEPDPEREERQERG